LLYEDFLDPHLLGLCEFEGTSCLDACKRDAVGLKAPFVEVDGKLYSEMTPRKLSEILKEAAHVGG
jgi:NADH:ubiquinone oxidoreductase subunit E